MYEKTMLCVSKFLPKTVVLVAACCAAQGFANVQILQVQDAGVLASSPSLPDSSGAAGVGSSDRFCVVNTLGRGVRLTFAASNAAAGLSPTLRNTATGATVAYRQSVSLANGSLAKLIQLDAAGSTFDVPASAVVTSAAACPPGGNVMKWITLSTPLPSADVWVDQVSMTATPL
jgi:hypothetical protein